MRDWKAFSHIHRYLQEKDEHPEQMTECSIQQIVDAVDSW
jgi:hypothetical protein